MPSHGLAQPTKIDGSRVVLVSIIILSINFPTGNMQFDSLHHHHHTIKRRPKPRRYPAKKNKMAPQSHHALERRKKKKRERAIYFPCFAAKTKTPHDTDQNTRDKCHNFDAVETPNHATTTQPGKGHNFGAKVKSHCSMQPAKYSSRRTSTRQRKYPNFDASRQIKRLHSHKTPSREEKKCTMRAILAFLFFSGQDSSRYTPTKPGR